VFHKLPLLAAFGAGYVLGSKAGTQRYDQIVAAVRDLAGKPAVQDLRDKAAHQVSETASHLGEAAKDKAKEVADDAIAGVRAKVTGEPTIETKISGEPTIGTPA